MPKPLIPAETVYDEALRILDEEGLDGLNARNLAARLRCSMQTIYQQVGNREEMVRGIVAHAIAEVKLDFEPGQTWQETIVAWCQPLRGFILDHPAVAGLMSVEDRDTLGTYAVKLIRALRKFGWDEDDAIRATGFVHHVTLSMTLSDIKAPGEYDQPEVFANGLRWIITGMESDNPVRE